MNTIELHPAFMFDCHNCGMENFHRGVVVAFSPEDVASVADMYAIEDAELVAGTWHFKPAEVVCQHCQAKYAVAGD